MRRVARQAGDAGCDDFLLAPTEEDINAAQATFAIAVATAADFGAS